MGGIPALYDGIFGQGGASGGLADQALGSAESSLYGSDALTNPAGALGGASGGLTPAQWQDIIAGQPENGFTPEGFATPGPLTQFANATGLSSIAGKIPQLISAAGKIPGLAGGAAGGAGGGSGAGGGLLGRGSTEDAVSLLKAFYGDPNATGAKYLARQRGLL
jgi:hypothetical protein